MPKKAQKAEPPPPPPRKAPPILKLVGTVLLDRSEAAIIDAGGSVGPAYYKVGDSIEEFVIKSIQKEIVMLERDDGMVLTVGSKTPVAPASNGARPVLHQPLATSGNNARSDMPPALVPKKSALMAP